jgi:glycosyltransferase involved in cell wall biosynthesis
LNKPGVEFIGEVDEQGKGKLLGDAQAVLFPIDWPEPFGLVMIEAMACGTPVLAFRRGSVPEIIDPDVTGAVVDTLDEAIEVMPRVLELDRRAVRRRFEKRFSSARMAEDYAALYQSLIAQSSRPVHAHTKTPISILAKQNGRMPPEKRPRTPVGLAEVSPGYSEMDRN